LSSDEVETSREDGARIGTDIVEIERFRGFKEDSPFVQKVYTKDEISYCYSFEDPAPHLAATFAGKEAVTKALEMNNILSIGNIEILRKASGAPMARHHEIPEDIQIRVSLSHSSTHAVAVAMAYAREQSPKWDRVQNMIDSAVLELLQGE
jgi:holo-[acyl-carrier protein] synthase